MMNSTGVFTQDSSKMVALAQLRDYLNKDTTVYTIYYSGKAVSDSEFSRKWGFVVVQGGVIVTITPLVALALGRPHTTDATGNKFIVGPNLGSDYVMALSALLFGDGYMLRHQNL